MSYRLLLISMDEGFKGLLTGCVASERHQLESVTMGTRGMEIIQNTPPDLLILDTHIPDMGGLTWLKMARHTEAGRNVPVIVAGREKNDAEVAEAFEWGADDFILKNTDPSELSARIRAVLRRRFERQDQLGQAMNIGPIHLDPSRHECRVRGSRVDLKARQFELLEILMRKAGRVLSRVYLLETIWGMSRFASTRAVDVGISRLRLALGARAGRHIETVERFGYRFNIPDEPARGHRET